MNVLNLIAALFLCLGGVIASSEVLAAESSAGTIEEVRKWDVVAVGRNLGDEEYMVYAFDLSFFGFNEEMIGTPRYFGLEASFSF